MTQDESRFFSLLQVRLAKTKDLLNFEANSRDVLENEPPIYFNLLKNFTPPTARTLPSSFFLKKKIKATISGNTNYSKYINNEKNFSYNTLLDSFQIKEPVNTSSGLATIITFVTDSTAINHQNNIKANEEMHSEKTKLFKPTNNTNVASISPIVHMLKVASKYNKKNIIEKYNKKTIDSSEQHIARDALEDWQQTIPQMPQRKIWNINFNNTIPYQPQYNIYNQISHAATPINNIFYEKIHKLSNLEELPIKNEIQIRKIQHNGNINKQWFPEQITTKNLNKHYIDSQQYLEKNLISQTQSTEINNESQKTSSFKVIPLTSANHISKPKIIHRPTLTFIQHQQRQMQNKLINEKTKKQKIENLMPQEITEQESQLVQNFELLQKIQQNTTIPPKQDLAAFNGLLNCCQQQAPGCKHLCSKSISKEEVM